MRARADGARDVIDAQRRAGFGARRSSSVQITRQSVAMIAKNHQTIHATAPDVREEVEAVFTW